MPIIFVCRISTITIFALSVGILKVYSFSPSDTDCCPVAAKVILSFIISGLTAHFNVTVFFSGLWAFRFDSHCNRCFSFKNGVKSRFFKHSLKQNAPFSPVWYTNTVSPPHGKTAKKPRYYDTVSSYFRGILPILRHPTLHIPFMAHRFCIPFYCFLPMRRTLWRAGETGSFAAINRFSAL